MVPIGIFGSALLSGPAVGYQEEIWQAAGIVSVFAVVCGTLLTGFALARQSHQPLANAVRAEKEHVEDDAYDVVSRGVDHPSPMRRVGATHQTI